MKPRLHREPPRCQTKFKEVSVSAVVRRTESKDASRIHFVLFQLQQAGGQVCVDANMELPGYAAH